jgi:multicomponent Na+:H+ antiporter subunit C
MEILIAICIGTLFGTAVYQFLRRNVIRVLFGMILLSNAVNLYLLATGTFSAQHPAYIPLHFPYADPIPQALVLTAIVIGMGALAFMLALVLAVMLRYRTLQSDNVRSLKN